MENLKFTLTAIIILIVLGLLGFWALTTIDSGQGTVSKQELRALEDENQELRNQILKLEDELALYKPAEEEETTEETQEEETTTEPDTYKNQKLIDELQKLIDDGIYMKKGSAGTRVGTVQNFLNLYNGTSGGVDNDYGNGTKDKIIAFQKAEGITADGEAGPGTFKKMIDWLKKQG